MSLLKIYKKLKKPENTNKNSFNTENLKKSNNHYIGINGLGHIAILFCTTSPKGKEENIQNLQLHHGMQATIKFNGKESKKKFSILRCTSKEERLREIFLSSLNNIIENIAETISEKEIYEKTKSLIELYKQISKSKNYDLIGFWGELFIIKILNSKELLIEAFHPKINDTFDFFLENKALEIKSTTSNDRKHIFSFDQLNSKNNIIIIGSVMLRKSRTGISLLDLKNDILKDIGKKYLKEKLQEIYDIYTGSKTQKELNDIKYNFKYSKDNLKFFDSTKVPRIKETPMYGVKNIKFVSDLNSAESISKLSDYEFLK
ncbi:PD-(D/E)XK motif protein [Candidatus Pelagibacter sp. Uisw_106]|uniref:PD-(D/E)XK motif protein n=1 Tax=Candidatus Pelagibacter sp. Uisw_106 TaxID=3230984 RepID=UPI0039E97142